MKKIIKLFTLLLLGSSLFISACNTDEKLSNQKNDLITYVDEEIDTLESSLITKIDETIAKINALEEKYDAKVQELEVNSALIKSKQEEHTSKIDSLNDELISLNAQYEVKINELESKDKELKDSLSALELEIANQNELNETKHNSLTSEIEKANSDLAKLEEDYNNEVKTLNDNLGLLQKELDDFELQVANQDKVNKETHSTLLENISEVTNQLTALDNKYKEETDTLKETQKDLQEELDVLESRIENNETIDEERYNALLEDINVVNETLSSLDTKHNNEVTTLTTRLDSLQEELDEFEEQVSNKNKVNEETHNTLLQSITNTNNELSSLNTKHNNDVTSLNTKLDSLQQELDDLETLMEEQDALMKEEYTSLVNQLEEVDKEIKEVNENQNKNIKEIEDNIALVNETHERDIETLTNQKNEIIDEINTIKTDIESLNSNLSKEISDVKTSLNLLESMLKNEDTRLQGEITKLNNLVDTLSTLIESNNGKINELQQELGYLKSEVEDLRNKLEEKVCDEHNVLDWELVEVLEDGTKIYIQKCDKCDTIIDMNIEKYEGDYVYDHNVHYIINEDGTYSNANNHIFIDEYCVECGVHESITSLEFSLMENGLEYALVRQNISWYGDLVIPREYKGLPVTTIYLDSNLDMGITFYIPKTITKYYGSISYARIYLESNSLPDNYENIFGNHCDIYLGYAAGKYQVNLIGISGKYTFGAYVNKGDMLPNVDVLDDLTKKGYVFTGYYDLEDGTKYYDGNMNCVKAWDKEENGTLYAQWESETYTIIFDANGGEGEMDSMSISYEEAYNSEILLPKNILTNDQKMFMGWSLYEDGEVMYLDKSEAYEIIYDVNPTNNEEIRIYAIWKNEYTYHDYTNISPSNWNELTYQDDNDTQILDYISSQFYGYNFKFDDVGEIIPGDFVIEYSAVTKLEDVTTEYAGDKEWGIPSYVNEHRAYKITLRNDLKWDDGTPIHAEDFVYTMKEQLNPLFRNHRADSFYKGDFVIYNADKYLIQGGTEKYVSVSSVYDSLSTAMENHDEIYLYASSLTDFVNMLFGYSNLPLSYYQDSGYLDDYFALYVDDGDSRVQIMDEKGITPLNFFEKYGLLSDPSTRVRITTQVINDFNSMDILKKYLNLDIYLNLLSVIINYVYPEVNWSKVGMFVGDTINELVIILDKSLNLLKEDGTLSNDAINYMANLPLVKRDLYEKCKREPLNEQMLWTSVYNSSVETSASWGPYKLTEYQKGKHYILEKNENWFGYNMPEYEGQYQTTRIEVKTIEDSGNAWQKFLTGEITKIGFDTSVSNEYRNSARTLFAPDLYTTSIHLQSSKIHLEARESENINKTILTYPEFRQAISLAVDREYFNNYCTYSLEGYGLFNSSYYYDVENHNLYRDTSYAKKALCDAYGVIIDEFPSVDVAVDSITGYDIEKARELVTIAYKKALHDGEIDEDDKVIFTFGSGAEINKTIAEYNFLYNSLSEMVKETPLEGRLEIKLEDHQENWFNDFRAGLFDICISGWGSNTRDVESLLSAFLDPNFMLSFAWDTYNHTMTFMMPELANYDYDGEGVEFTMVLTDWYDCLNGGRWSKNEVPVEARLALMARIEQEILLQYYAIPISYNCNVSLLSYQVEYITTEYNQFMGYGGIRYMTYNYDDAAWDEYCKNNELDYTL